MMKEYEIEILETLIVVVFLFVLKLLLRRLIQRIIRKFNFHEERKILITNIFNLFFVIFAVIATTAIWSVDPKQFLVFLASILTVIGVAFFAQWSILSNVTSTLILFFSHPLKIGGYIKINDKDFPVEGVVEKISFFFLYIKTSEGEVITMPTSIVMQKTITYEETKL